MGLEAGVLHAEECALLAGVDLGGEGGLELEDAGVEAGVVGGEGGAAGGVGGLGVGGGPRGLDGGIVQDMGLGFADADASLDVLLGLHGGGAGGG